MVQKKNWQFFVCANFQHLSLKSDQKVKRAGQFTATPILLAKIISIHPLFWSVTSAHSCILHKDWQFDKKDEASFVFRPVERGAKNL